MDNQSADNSFRFSLQDLFLLSTMVIGFVAIGTGHRMSGLTVTMVSVYLYYESRHSLLPDLLKKRRQIRVSLGASILFLLLCCYRWWHGHFDEMTGFLSVWFCFQGLAQWFETRSLRT